MPVAFGFSVGDFINCLFLLQKSVAAFSAANGASASLAQLEIQLEGLLSAVQTVSTLIEDGVIGSDQQKPISAAVKACQKVIDDFYLNIAQYQKHLKRDQMNLRTCYMKIKWALCKQEDMAKLRSTLKFSSDPITMLLIAHQSQAIQTLTKTVQDHEDLIRPGIEYEEQVQELSYMLKSLSMRQAESLEAAEKHHRVSLSKFEALQTSLQMQGDTIPAQVTLQQPVILLDALGRRAPFHLEFVDSIEAFVAVMVVRFKQAGISDSGLRKLINLEFTLRDTRRKRPIDLTKPWCSALRPGQIIDMNMLYPTVIYRLARLSVKHRKLLCYNFWFPCLTNTPTQPQLLTSGMIGPEPDSLVQPTQRYDRLEEFSRVHLILETGGTGSKGLSVPMEASALTTFMENVGHAFSIYWQHLVVTVGSDVAFEADLCESSSSSVVRSMGRSSRRDFLQQRESLRPRLPDNWDSGSSWSNDCDVNSICSKLSSTSVY